MTRRGRAPIPEHARTSVQWVAAYGQDRARLDEKIAANVVSARAAGATWGHIGDALGISPQAAQQRYGKSPNTK